MTSITTSLKNTLMPNCYLLTQTVLLMSTNICLISVTITFTLLEVYARCLVFIQLFSVCLNLFCRFIFVCDVFLCARNHSVKKKKINRLEIVLITSLYYTTKRYLPENIQRLQGFRFRTQVRSVLESAFYSSKIWWILSPQHFEVRQMNTNKNG